MVSGYKDYIRIKRILTVSKCFAMITSKTYQDLARKKNTQCTIYWAWTVQSFNNSRNLIRRAVCLFLPFIFEQGQRKSLNIVHLNHLLFQHQRMLATIFKDISHALISSTINHITLFKIIFEMKLDRYVRKRIKNYVVLLYQLCGFTVEDTQFSDCRIDDVILQWQKLHSSFKLT